MQKQKTIGVFFETNHLERQKDRLRLFLEHISPDEYSTLVFIVVPEHTFRTLDEYSTGDKRINYVNSDGFIGNIIYSFCTVHDPVSKTILLGDCKAEYLLEFIDAVNLYFESSFSIISEYNDSLLEAGFENPFICYKNKICISRPSGFLDKAIDSSITHRDIKYLQSQQEGEHCSILIEIAPETIEYLKFTTKASVKSDNTGRYQREVFGHLNVVSNKDEHGRIVYTLKVDKDSLVHGSAEKISNITPYLYTFHSHPYEAYVRHKTQLGFPSASDYISMYTLYEFKAIMHFVAALEGLYVISVNTNSKMLKKSKDKIVEFIKKHYNLEKKSVVDIGEYIDMVNSHGLFKLELIPWDECSTRKIEVMFGKSTDGNCVIR